MKKGEISRTLEKKYFSYRKNGHIFISFLCLILITFAKYNLLWHAVKKSIFHRFIEALKKYTAFASQRGEGENFFRSNFDKVSKLQT